MASGSGPEMSPVSSVPADMGERGFEYRLDLGRLSFKPEGAGRSSLENWVAMPPGVIVPEAEAEGRLSGVPGGFDIVAVCNMNKVKRGGGINDSFLSFIVARSLDAL